MTFDVYFPFTDANGVTKPGIKPHASKWEDIRDWLESDKVHIQSVTAVRQAATKKERDELKKKVRAVTPCGRTSSQRRNDFMSPTGLFMVDIDHVENALEKGKDALRELIDTMGDEWVRDNVYLFHVTVSGKGWRFFMKWQAVYQTLEDNMTWFYETFNFSRTGDFDAPCKDFSRLSFLPLAEDIIYESPHMCDENMDLLTDCPLVNDSTAVSITARKGGKQGELFSEAEQVGEFTEAEVQKFENYEYKGHLVKEIVAKWIEHRGEPGEGERHNFYNEMVKYFRNIVSNNGRALLYLLPRFGHSVSECWSQIQSITRVNTLSSLPKPFFFFLKDNGFLDKNSLGKLDEYMLQDEPEPQEEDMPWLPPVFREYLRITPKDFRVSMVNALLPIMGTLTSYLQAKYYYDNRMHTTSFFSVIYAPPGTGKGFVERCMDQLFETMKMRDYVQQAREKIYLDVINRKGDNEKSPEDPHTSLRIIPPKNSEAEFLGKQQENHGYHMFTYAAEMDSWAKGVRAAGGNKDDMIRIAWDNGEYGQQFKSSSTFKGVVQLFWNVLITGTIQQLLSYFKNVENGLITRCSFTTIENQEYAEAPIWKEMSRKEINALRKFMNRCDENSYEEPCNLVQEDVDCVSADKFDQEIEWRFRFKKRQTVDMAWLRPTIDAFLEKQLKRAALDLDKARDVFRRRVAVRGFRLGLMCYALWEKPRECDLKKCIPFIEWWMEQDLESSLNLWGTRYNEEVKDLPNLSQRSIFSQLPKAFTKEDVYVICKRQGVQTPVRQITYQWIKLGYVKKTGKGEFEKTDAKV